MAGNKDEFQLIGRVRNKSISVVTMEGTKLNQTFAYGKFKHKSGK